jgi:hypothetical protein
MTETACATLALIELLNDLEVRLNDRDQHQLSDTLPDGNLESRLATVPAGHHQFALVVRVDQAHQVAEHDAVLMTQA